LAFRDDEVGLLKNLQAVLEVEFPTKSAMSKDVGPFLFLYIWNVLPRAWS